MAETTVDSPAAEYLRMTATWTMLRALLGGTRTMRDAGDTYLPKFEAETKENYKRRLNTSVLFAGLSTTVRTMVGLPFAKPIAKGDDMAPRIKALCENIDGAGSNLDVFCRRLFSEALPMGAAHILVDMPATAPMTAADDRARNPRWIMVPPESLIAAQEAEVQGERRFVYARIRETVVEWVGGFEKEIAQVREIDCRGAPLWRVWRKVAAQKGGKEEWTVHEEGAYGLPYVTISPFFAGQRRGVFTADSPLENLAYLNVAHWQSASDQRNILTFSRFGILVIKGAPEGELKIGPTTILSVGEDGDAKIIEHGGAAIQAGERDLKMLEAQMEAEGVRFLTKRPGVVTATENAIDESKDQSELEAMALAFKDTIELALQHTAAWLGFPLEEGGSVKINTDFGIVGNAKEIRDTILRLREMGDISAEDALRELKAAGLLSDDLDETATIERARQEMPGAADEREV